MLQWITGVSSQVSFYDHAEKLINIPLSLISVMSTVMMPRIANEFKNKNRDQIEILLNKAGRFALFAAFPMMFGLACIADKFIPWYLGAEFAPVASAMVVLSPIVILNSLSGISGQQYFTATNQIKILMRAYVSAALLNVIVNGILIPGHGYMGAAVATVGSSLISTVLQYYYLNRQVEVTGLVRYGIRYLAASIVMAVVIYLPTRGMSASVKTTAFQIMAGIVVYLALMLLLKDQTMFELLQKLRIVRRGREGL
jgi:O-antigen/teichoic acid export membrane protein